MYKNPGHHFAVCSRRERDNPPLVLMHRKWLPLGANFAMGALLWFANEGSCGMISKLALFRMLESPMGPFACGKAATFTFIQTRLDTVLKISSHPLPPSPWSASTKLSAWGPGFIFKMCWPLRKSGSGRGAREWASVLRFPFVMIECLTISLKKKCFQCMPVCERESALAFVSPLILYFSNNNQLY